MVKMKCLFVVVLSVLMLILAGCGHRGVADATGTVTGKVIDGSTQQPVKDAEVTLIVNGTRMVTKTSNSDDPDLAGIFVFGGVPALSGFDGSQLKIEAAGFATTQRSIPADRSFDNSPVTTNLGTISLGRGFDLTVVATDNASPVAGVTIVAASMNSFGVSNITAVTDADGKAVLAGLSQVESYNISSAPFYDSTGNIKYKSTNAAGGSFNFNPQNSDRMLSIALDSAGRQDNIRIIASNLLSDGSQSNSVFPPRPAQNTTTPDGAIKIVFNFPVELTGGVSASFTNNLVLSTAPDFDKVILVPTVTAALDATKTILTITNSAPYIKNQTYTFNGSVIAKVNGQTQTFNLDQTNPFAGNATPVFSNVIAIADNTATGLNAATVLKADNFNGTSGATATAVPAQLFVEFPEAVSGSYRLISSKSGTTTTTHNSPSFSFTPAAGNTVFAGNFGGSGSDVVFRLPIVITSSSSPFFSPSLNLADNSEVTMFFDIIDAEGNRFSKELTLTVQ